MAKGSWLNSPPPGYALQVVGQQSSNAGQVLYIEFTGPNALQEAIADQQAHGVGTLVYGGAPVNASTFQAAQPNPSVVGANAYGGSSSSSSLPALPSTTTGWYQVHSGNKSWKFSDGALAQRAAAATGGRITGNVSPPPQQWMHTANPQGPAYV